MTRKFKSTSLADQVFEKLENDIIQGVYSRGELLTELRLAEELGVSRTPIREALRRLEQERLIEETGKGSRVLGISVEDVEDIMNIREQVEGIAAWYAAQNGTEEDRANLKHLMELQGFYYQNRDGTHISQIDDQLHDTICRMSGRPVIMDILIALNRKTKRYRYLSAQDWERTGEIAREHMAICQAIIDGDAEEAKAASGRHAHNVRVHLTEVILKKEGIDV